MGGLCFLCSNKAGPGHIRHLDYGYVKFAEFATRGVTDRMRQIGEDFQRAGIPIQLHDDLLLARWQKLIWNIPYNGLSVILNATTADLMANDHTRQLVTAIMREVAAAATACGHPIHEEFIQRMLADTAKMIPYRTSMKIDHDEHRPMEIEAIFGNPLRAAQQAGGASPLLDSLYRQLQFLDERNRGSDLESRPVPAVNQRTATA
jgi:2-dehydropantoate 2-reductase